MDAKMIITMDVSGSVGMAKRIIAKQFYSICKAEFSKRFNLLQPLFIEHSTTAAVTTEEKMFDSKLSGGTYLSSGISIIMKEDLCDGENILIILSDGDNWGEDNNNLIERLNFLKDYFDLMIYVEIKATKYVSTISSEIYEKCKFVKIINLDKILNDEDELKQILNIYDILGFI